MTDDANQTRNNYNLMQVSYRYDVAGNLLWRYDSGMQTRTPPVNWSNSFAYDTLGRLATAAQGAVNWTGTPMTMTATNSLWDWSQKDAQNLPGLDKLGNWRLLNFGKSGSIVTDTRSHDAVNKIATRTCTNKTSPTWDANGNLTCDGDQTHQPFGVATTLHFAYDYRNRLVSATDDSGNLVAAYTYDGLNRRVRKQTYDTTATVVADVWTLWRDWQCVEEDEEDDATGTFQGLVVQTRHVYGPGGLDDHAALLVSPGWGTHWVYRVCVPDRLGSLQAVAPLGTYDLERYQYAPYGQMTITDPTGRLVRPTSTCGNNYGFTGQFYDSDLGLYYYKNRWYSPDLGRFTTEDPSGYKDGMNLYQYVKSMPTMMGDVMGLESDDNIRDNALLMIGDKASLDYLEKKENPDPAAIKTSAALIPGVGEAMAAHDLIEDLHTGNYVCAGLDIGAFIPEAGAAFKGAREARLILKATEKLEKELQLAKKAGKDVDVLEKKLKELKELQAAAKKDSHAAEDANNNVNKARGDSATGEKTSGDGKASDESQTPTPTGEKPAPPDGDLRMRMGDPPSDMVNPQAHHDLPQAKEFQDQWKRAGLDNNDPAYGRWVEGGKEGNHQKWSKAFNDEWRAFFGQNKKPTKQDILDQLNKMRKDKKYQ